MVESENSNIPSIILILGPALITGLTSYFIARLQLKIKDKEVIAQARLKAKTLLFESYEKSLENLTKQSSQLSGTIGKIYASFDSPLSENDDETFKNIDSMLRIFRINMNYFRDVGKYFESELKKNSMLNDDRKEKLNSIIDTTNKTFNPLTIKDLRDELDHYVEFTSHITVLQSELIEHKREQLFSDIL